MFHINNFEVHNLWLYLKMFFNIFYFKLHSFIYVTQWFYLAVKFDSRIFPYNIEKLHTILK